MGKILFEGVDVDGYSFHGVGLDKSIGEYFELKCPVLWFISLNHDSQVRTSNIVVIVLLTASYVSSRTRNAVAAPKFGV